MVLLVKEPQRLAVPGSDPCGRSKRVGKITLLQERAVHDMAQYPGADKGMLLEPQTVELRSNGYFVTASFEGTVTWRGRYGGEVGVRENYHLQMYAYEIDSLLSEDPASYLRTLLEVYKIEIGEAP